MRTAMAVALLLVIMSAPAWGAKEEATPSLPADAAAMAASARAMGVDLYGACAAGEGDLVYSPLSVHAALAMAWTGAGGKTADEMARVLHLAMPKDRSSRAYGALLRALTAAGEAGEGEDARPYALYLAASLWRQKGLKVEAPFAETLRSSFLASAFEADFAKPEAARRTINDWVGGFTEHKIKEVVPQGGLTDRTRVVLASAIYFRSKWEIPFRRAATKDAPFRVSAEKTVTVSLMSDVSPRRYLETAEFQAVEMPYAARRASMVLFVPRKVDGLAAFEKSLTADALDGWLRKLQAAEVAVKMPRFQMTGAMRLAPALQALGMKDAFSMAADFTGIARTAEGLFLSDVFHNAFIAVDEFGTEAAAASAVALEAKDGGEPKTVTADHPFFFLIRDNASGAVLFMGRVVEPTKGSD